MERTETINLLIELEQELSSLKVRLQELASKVRETRLKLMLEKTNT